MKAVDLCDPNVEPTDEELEDLVKSMHKKVMEKNKKAFDDFYDDLAIQMAAIKKDSGHGNVCAK